LTSGALSTAGTLTEVLAGFFVVLFTLFFFLRDGGQIWQFLCRLLPRTARVPVARAGHYSWHTLVSYVRATVLVAFVDALGIGIGLAILRIPLALPLAALVFLGAFIPVVGATLSGVVAVLVALVTHGPLSAGISIGRWRHGPPPANASEIGAMPGRRLGVDGFGPTTRGQRTEPDLAVRYATRPGPGEAYREIPGWSSSAQSTDDYYRW
jgi:hypothetical protein